MSPEGVVDWAKSIAIFGAIVFGGFAVFSPSWVWFRMQSFKWGSAVLLGFGTILLVSPSLRNVHFVVDTKGLQFKLDSLQADIGQARQTLAALTQEIDKLGPINAAHMKELEQKIQTVNVAVAAINTELPKLAELGPQIKKFEQTAATLTKNVELLDKQPVFLTNSLSAKHNPILFGLRNSWKSPYNPTTIGGYPIDMDMYLNQQTKKPDFNLVPWAGVPKDPTE